ncbi:MAG TPA: hypothetical protein ENN81_01535 [Phycisphaerales bacterium]|nr:hypothetical protein [Phycisphaerales bacterium]
MERRTFLKAMAAGAGLGLRAFAGQMPDDLKITRIVAFDLISDRPKLIGKNSRLDVHGVQTRDRMVRLFTNTGLEGLGNCRAGQEQLGLLLGRHPLGYYRPLSRTMAGPLGAGTMPLWDLVGKIMGKPVYELLGGVGSAIVPIYDGSLYFSDLLDEYHDNYLDRFRREIDMSWGMGHRAFKVKIGRGAKWMDPKEGYERDKEVVRSVREHVGPGAVMGVDANDGYSLNQAAQLLVDLPGVDLAFMEEMFPEDIDKCLALKEFIRRRGLKARIADGETQGDLEAFRPFIEARAIDIFQGDMNHFGFEGILAAAAICKGVGARIAPHNWGSLVGFYMQLHVGRAVANFYRAEHDAARTSVLAADGYHIRDGYCSVPDAPGFGLSIYEPGFEKAAKIQFDLKA